ncbi:PRR29 protein, partial [Donacobius atricapilla]|nr:PRR29 protein [Donacobius atricapilla]
PLGAVPVWQPPVLILQQLPGPGAAPAGPPPVRGDLVELMLIQTSQMHQLLMHGLAVAALMPHGVGPAPAPTQALAGPSQGEEEEEAVVFHHHYIPWLAPSALLTWGRGVSAGGGARCHLGVTAGTRGTPLTVTDLSLPLSSRAVPPPPPPSATGTVGPGVPPAAGKDTLGDSV